MKVRAEWVVAHPFWIFAVVALLVGLSLTRLFDFSTLQPRVEVDPSMAALLPRDGAALATFERAHRYFPDDDVLFVAWIADDLFSPAKLGALKQLTRRVQHLPGVLTVESLATAFDVQIEDEQTTIDPFLRHLPVDDESAARLKARALANPLFRGQLVSEDGRGALLAVHFAATLDTADLLARVAQIRVDSAALAGSSEQFVSGPLLVRLEIGRILNRDVYRVTPFAALATLLVAALGLRSVRGVLLPVIANGSAVVMTLAAFVANGHGLNFVTAILPPVVYVVGFAYAIHVVSDFDRLYQADVTRREAARLTLHEVFVPLTLTAVTTAIGFASLAVTNIASIRDFGLYAALGTLLAWGTALTVVPAGLALLPGRQRTSRATQATEKLAARLAHFDLSQRAWLYGICAVLTLAAAWAATRIEVDTRVLRNFDSSLAVQRDFQRIGQVFDGPVPMQILIDAEQVDAFKDPANLREIARLAAWLRAQAGVGGVYALSDYVAMLYRGLSPQEAARDPLPASARLVAQLLLGGGGNAAQYVDPEFRSTLIEVRTTALSTAAVNALAARLQQRLAALPPGLHGQVTGTSYLIARSVEDITMGQLQSFGLALFSTFVLLSVVFASPRVGLLALIPNALPIVLFFGLLGAIPIPYDLSTSLVADSVFGIAIDDTVVFMSCFALESRRHGTGLRGVEATLAVILRPATLTTAALCVGFLALMAGELRSQAEFGMLAAASLFFAWLLDITLTPLLCHGRAIEMVWSKWRDHSAAE